MNYKNVIISFWYKEMLESPATKVVDLENSLKSLFDNPFLYNDMPVNENIDVPRVQCKSQDSKYLLGSVLSTRVKVDNEMEQIPIIYNSSPQEKGAVTFLQNAAVLLVFEKRKWYNELNLVDGRFFRYENDPQQSPDPHGCHDRRSFARGASLHAPRIRGRRHPAVPRLSARWLRRRLHVRPLDGDRRRYPRGGGRVRNGYLALRRVQLALRPLRRGSHA